jgi:hypothetical protein
VKVILFILIYSFLVGAQALPEKSAQTPTQDTSASVFSVVPGEATKKYSKIFLVSDFDLIGFSWSDLSIDQEANFSTPIISSWIKWLTPLVSSEVVEVLPCRDECRFTFSKWLQNPLEQKNDLPDDFKNSLWLRISYKIRKVRFDPDIDEWDFEWEGSAVFLDVNSKQAIASKTIEVERKMWRGLGQKALNSALATSLYKSALDHLHKASLSLKESERPDRLSRVFVQGQRKISDILSLIELLKKEGASLKLTAKLDVIGSKEAQIVCFYKGEEKSFNDLLSRLKELKSSQRYGVVNESKDIHYVIKLIAP